MRIWRNTISKQDKPTPPVPTPAPIASDITDEVASDLIRDRKKRKAGRSASFLTRGQRSDVESEARSSLLQKRKGTNDE